MDAEDTLVVQIIRQLAERLVEAVELGPIDRVEETGLKRGPLPTVTTLTLSSPRKATPFRIILWRCRLHRSTRLLSRNRDPR
jgi:hypothetical protein